MAPTTTNYFESFQYVQDIPREERVATKERLMARNPSGYMVICEAGKNTPALVKTKFILQPHYTVGMFMQRLRQHSPALKPTEAYTLFFNRALPGPMTTIEQVVMDVPDCMDEDGFIFCRLHRENVFG